MHLPLGRFGFGCEQLGGHGWGVVDPGEVLSAISEALDRGVTFFDTADCYGLGRSEELLGHALRAAPDALVATKFGVRFDAAGRVFYDNGVAWLDAALHASLKRLRRDHIDLYQLHHRNPDYPLEPVVERLERHRAAGLIRAWGICNTEPTAVSGPIRPASFSWEFSLVRTEREQDIRAGMASGYSFIAYGCLAQGLLAGRHDGSAALAADDRRRRPAYVNFHGERLARNLAVVEVLRRVAANLPGATPAQVALAWIHHVLPGCTTLLGIKRPAQLRDGVAGTELVLPADALADLAAAVTCPVA